MKTNITEGPWMAEPNPEEPNLHLIWTDEEGVDQMSVLVARTCYAPASEANGALLAMAPDMALLLRAMCQGKARWESWGDHRGEICANGMRYAAQLNAFGIPELQPHTRAVLERITMPDRGGGKVNLIHRKPRPFRVSPFALILILAFVALIVMVEFCRAMLPLFPTIP